MSGRKNCPRGGSDVWVEQAETNRDNRRADLPKRGINEIAKAVQQVGNAFGFTANEFTDALTP